MEMLMTSAAAGLIHDVADLRTRSVGFESPGVLPCILQRG